MDLINLMLTPDLWMMVIFAFAVMAVSVYSFLHAGKRLTDRTMPSLFFVYCLYQIIYYGYLAYQHFISGGSILANSPQYDAIHFIARIKDYYLVIAMCYLMGKSICKTPSSKGGFKWKQLFRSSQ